MSSAIGGPWLLCPKCEGTGVQADPAPGLVMHPYACSQCNKRGIVTPDELNGLDKTGDPEKVTIQIMVETEVYLVWDDLVDSGELEKGILPKNVSAQDVIELLKCSGSRISALNDWDLTDPEISVFVQNSSGERTNASW